MDRDARKALLRRYRVTRAKGFSLADRDPGDLAGHELDAAEGKILLEEGVDRLSELQKALYADGRWALLATFQAMDAGGKDGTIQHVMSGVNPQGVSVTSFKQPGSIALGHDFLWRIHAAVPARGRIGIFNRSHYEEVLVAKVHPEVLDRQDLPEARRGGGFWKQRMKDIRHFESYLNRQGIVVLKFFLHISKEEQRQRFLARLQEPDKNWKFSSGDLAERAHWDRYQQAYEEAIAGTATPEAPWFVVPGDHKWFARVVVVEAMIQALERMRLAPPAAKAEDEAKRAQARRALEAEG